MTARELLRLDLGCGAKPQPGFMGVDIAPLESVWVHDLRKTPWPWPDGSVAEVRCAHFFEHLEGDERLAFMDECYRILVPGGPLTIVCPHWESVRAHMDPTHKYPPITERSMLYFDRRFRVARDIAHYPIRCHFSGWFSVFPSGVGKDIKFELFREAA